MGWYNYTIYSCSPLMTYKYIIQIAIISYYIHTGFVFLYIKTQTQWSVITYYALSHTYEDSLRHQLSKLMILNKQYS